MVRGDRFDVEEHIELYNTFPNGHPFRIVTSPFNNIREAVDFLKAFKEEYSKLFGEIDTENPPETVVEKALAGYFVGIERNLLFSIDGFSDKVIDAVNLDYVRLLKQEMSLEDFTKSMSDLIEAYHKHVGFNSVWDNMYVSKVANYVVISERSNTIGESPFPEDSAFTQYEQILDSIINFSSQFSVEFGLNTEAVELDRLQLEIITEQFETGDLREDDPNIENIIFKVLNNDYPLDFNAHDHINFSHLEKLQGLAIQNPKKIGIEVFEDLISNIILLKTYHTLLFNLQAISFLKYLLNHKQPIAKQVIELKKGLFYRMGRYREFYKLTQRDLHYIEANSPINALIDDYFKRQHKKAKSAEDKKKLHYEISIFYKAYPDFPRSFLESYKPLNLLDEIEVSQERAPMGKVETGDKQPIFVTLNETQFNIESEEFKEALLDLIRNSDVDPESIERVSRTKNWERYVIGIITALSQSSENLDKVIMLDKNDDKRISAISKLDDVKSAGGERALVKAIIDNGKNGKEYKELCAIIYILEFEPNSKKISIRVMNPEKVIGVEAENNIIKVIEKEEEKKVLEDFPGTVYDFLSQNNVTNFNFDFENTPISQFPYEVAMYLALLLANEEPYTSVEEMELSQQFIKVCIESSLKDSIKTELVRLIQAKDIELHLGDEKNDRVAIQKKTRIIAEQILNYFARTLRNSEQGFTAFTTQAQNVFRDLTKRYTDGRIDEELIAKETSSKAHVGDRFRIQFCYVNNKIEVVVTGDFHYR